MEGGTLQFAQVMFVVVMSCAGFVGVGLGARILWRKGSPRQPDAYRDDDRLRRLEMAVDTVAIEVERISESQRFMVGLMSESTPARRGELAGRAERVNTPH
jgi:hypothetical protein